MILFLTVTASIINVSYNSRANIKKIIRQDRSQTFDRKGEEGAIKIFFKFLIKLFINTFLNHWKLHICN